MYREPLERIIGRAAMDRKFRRKIFDDPETAFEEYDLNHDQIAALRNIPTDALERFAHRLAKRGEEPSTKS